MKKKIKHLKKILHENKDDLLYLLFVGLPAGVLSILADPFIDYSHVY